MNDDNGNSSDWEAKYWANREKQLAASRPTAAPQRPAYHGQPQGAPQTREIDPMQLLGQQMMQQAQGGRSSGHPVFLKEGAPYFRNIQGGDGFGNVIPLVRSMGKLSGVVGKEFVIAGETRGILIDGLNQVDFSKINEQSDRFGMYIIVKAPFVGNILVTHDTIIEIQQTALRHILKG